MKKVWEKVKSALKSRVEEKDFLSWIEPVQFGEVEGNTLSLEAPNNFYRKWFIDHYLDQTAQIFQEITGTQFTINIEVCSSLSSGQMDFGSRILGKAKAEAKAKAKNAASGAKAKSVGLNAKHSFSNFIEGPSNQLARAASASVGTKPGKSFNPLFIYGGTGLGKTHLINAIGNRICKMHPEMKVVALSSEKFMNEMINSIHHNRVDNFRKKYRKCDCLLIDDIQFLSGKERTQEEFFHTFNSLHETGSQIVLTSDRIPKEIPGIEERLRTRFSWGLVADIQPPELETRLAILREKAEVEKISLPDDVSFFLASKFHENVRDLEGAFVRLTAFASFNGDSISLDLAKKVLKNMIVERKTFITVDMVQKSVCEYFKIKMTDIKSQRRQRIVAVPRQIGMYLARKMTDSSFPDIGQQFGGRDHSTVIHACNKIKKMAKTDPQFDQTLETLEKTIRH